MAKYIESLPAERVSLINSLLRQDGISVRDVADMTFETCASGHSVRGWQACLYRWKEAGNHLRVVREGNLLADKYAVSDLTIRAMESALKDENPPNINLLNLLKSSKPVTTSIIDKLTEDISDRIKRSGQESPDRILRNSDGSAT